MSYESLDYEDRLNLYNNEAYDEALSQERASTDHGHTRCPDSDSLPYEESSIVNAFDSEADQVLDPNEIQRFRIHSVVLSYRLEAVNWMQKVHGYCKFRPETAYLSVKYFDRFLISNALPKGKGWPFQLLSVACLSLAAKMEEISVPLLLDLQMKELRRFLFEPKTVQRMELLVMASLQWRLRNVTPFDFIHYFITKLPCFGMIKFENYDYIISRASDIIVLTCQVIDFLEYSASEIAASAVLFAADQLIDDDRVSECFDRRVSIERVRECYSLMKKSICLFPHLKRTALMS